MKRIFGSAMLVLFLCAAPVAIADVVNCPKGSAIKKLSLQQSASGKSGRRLSSRVFVKAGKFKEAHIRKSSLKCVYKAQIDGVDLPKSTFTVVTGKDRCNPAKGFKPNKGGWLCTSSNPHQCKASCG